MVRNSLLMAALAASSFAFADDFGPGPGGAIPDATVDNTVGGQGNMTSVINISSSETVASFNSVTIFGLRHSWAGDVVISLISPAGTLVNLVHRIGQEEILTGFGDSSNYGADGAAPLTEGRTYTIVDSGGSILLAAALAAGPLEGIPAGTYNRQTHPVTGAPFTTNNNLGTLAGESLGGDWTLAVSDWAGGDTGAFDGWSFNADAVPEPTSIAVLALGLSALAARRRRARK